MNDNFLNFVLGLRWSGHRLTYLNFSRYITLISGCNHKYHPFRSICNDYRYMHWLPVFVKVKGHWRTYFYFFLLYYPNKGEWSPKIVRFALSLTVTEISTHFQFSRSKVIGDLLTPVMPLYNLIRVSDPKISSALLYLWRLPK